MEAEAEGVSDLDRSLWPIATDSGTGSGEGFGAGIGVGSVGFVVTAAARDEARVDLRDERRFGLNCEGCVCEGDARARAHASASVRARVRARARACVRVRASVNGSMGW